MKRSLVSVFPVVLVSGLAACGKTDPQQTHPALREKADQAKEDMAGRLDQKTREIEAQISGQAPAAAPAAGSPGPKEAAGTGKNEEVERRIQEQATRRGREQQERLRRLKENEIRRMDEMRNAQKSERRILENYR